MISSRVIEALAFSEANFKSTNEMFLIGANRERSRTAAIEQALAKVVEAAEKYEHIPIANNEFNSSNAPSNLNFIMREALTELERALGECGV